MFPESKRLHEKMRRISRDDSHLRRLLVCSFPRTICVANLDDYIQALRDTRFRLPSLPPTLSGTHRRLSHDHSVTRAVRESVILLKKTHPRAFMFNPHVGIIPSDVIVSQGHPPIHFSSWTP